MTQSEVRMMLPYSQKTSDPYPYNASHNQRNTNIAIKNKAPPPFELPTPAPAVLRRLQLYHPDDTGFNPDEMIPKKSKSYWPFNQRNKAAFEASLPTRTQIMLDSSFGKDNLAQSFYVPPIFRHVLILIYRSAFLSTKDALTLLKTSPCALRLHNLIQRYDGIDFRAIQGFPTDWKRFEPMGPVYQAQLAACTLHYHFDLSIVQRFVGGMHTSAHLDADNMATKLDGIVPPHILHQFISTLKRGAPNQCTAESSPENQQAFFEYGNHRSVVENHDLMLKTVTKEAKKGYVLVFPVSVLDFIIHAHRTPQGIVDIDHSYRKPRPVFDSTHRPAPWCRAINDHLDNKHEPTLEFPKAVMRYAVYLWNLRISYPREDILLGDDDVSGAFRRVKNAPNLLALHIYAIGDFMIGSTGQTFGDTTCPPNYESFALTRSHLARHLWYQPDIIERFRAALDIPIQLAEDPPEELKNTFAKATADEIHQGVYDRSGNRISPPYPAHVDDTMYADIRQLILRTIAASIISLFEVLGYPDPRYPSPLSMDKFASIFSHQRCECGIDFDSRRMTMMMTKDKRTRLVAFLREWKNSPRVLLLDAAKFMGHLVTACQTNRWGWAVTYVLMNAFRRALKQTYAKIMAYYRRKCELVPTIPDHFDDLPFTQRRLIKLVAPNMSTIAQRVFRSRSKIETTPQMTAQLTFLINYLSKEENPWEVKIGHHITRSNCGMVTTDACTSWGGGGYCEECQFWFGIRWSTNLMTMINPRGPKTDSSKLDINCLEFLSFFFAMCGVVTCLGHNGNNILPPAVKKFFPNGVPPLPIFGSQHDNTSAQSWAAKSSCKSAMGQPIVALFSALMATSDIGTNAQRISTDDNFLADRISRFEHYFCNPDSPNFKTQLGQLDRRLLSWDVFLPSPELISVVSSALSSPLRTELPKLPNNLGQLVPTSSTGSCFATL